MTKRMRERVEKLKKITGGSNVSGWMFDNVAMFVYGMVKLYQPDLVIQTGHLWGKSAVVVLEALTDGGAIEGEDPDGDLAFREFVRGRRRVSVSPRLVSIDPYTPGVPRWKEGIAYLTDTYGDAFQFVQEPSSKFFERPLDACSWARRVMGIVDGDHSQQGVRGDLEGLSKLGIGLIIVDDTG